MRQLRLQIVEPTEAFKDPIRFRAGLPLGVLFNILLHNFNEEDVENFRIKIAYSTQRYVLFRPRKTDMKSVPMQAHRFLGHVLIESNVWSTAGVVRISCVLLIPQRKQVCLERGNHIDRPFGQRNESTVTKYVSLLESPFSSKLAYQDIPIYPMASCSL
uniref:Integrator complex subunit 4/Protein SIEL C-terminal Ig-like domain-containing protein n=1 Tax=Ascaris lumbricoides TaxID=6252 RepID=A0A0M3INI9_ASCLU